MNKIKTILILLLVILPTCVTSTEIQYTNNGTDNTNMKIYQGGSVQNYFTKNYTMTAKSNNNGIPLGNYRGFCIDAALKDSPTNPIPAENIKDGKNGMNDLFHEGLLAIMEEGAEYYATMTALRSYIYTVWPNYATGEVTHTSYQHHREAFINEGMDFNRSFRDSGATSSNYQYLIDNSSDWGYVIVDWGDDKEEEKNLNHFLTSSYLNNNFREANTSDNRVLNTARSLYHKALNAMVDFIETGGVVVDEDKEGTGTAGKINIWPRGETESITGSNGLATKTYTYELDPDSNVTNGAITEYNFSSIPRSAAEAGDVYVSSISVSIDGGAYTTDLATLKTVTLNDNTKILLKFVVVGEKNSNDVDPCARGNFNFSIKFKDGNKTVTTTSTSSSGEVFVVAENSFSSTATSQRYVMYVPNEQNTNDTNIVENEETLKFDITVDEICAVDCSASMGAVTECEYPNTGDIDAGSITETEEILGCVVGGLKEDMAGNTHQLSVNSCEYSDNDSIKAAIDSPYCNIYCKEDYTSFKFPGVQFTTQGRYFKIDAEITATKTCYTDEIDVSKAQQDYNNASNISAKTNVVEQLNACSAWSLEDGVKPPTVEYNYDALTSELNNLTVNDNDKNLKLNTDKSDNVVDSVWGCSSNVNGEYDTCSTQATVGIKSTSTTTLSSIKYYKSSATSTLYYETPDVFYTMHPTGELIYSQSGSTPPEPSTLIDGLPITFEATDGLYKFYFNITNLGTFNDSCNTGRLIDSDNKKTSVAEAIEKSGDVADGILKEYFCYYDVPCLENCSTSGEIEQIVRVCPNCMTTVGDLYFRTYSSNNFNPNDRYLGYNWSYDFGVNDQFGFISNKAAYTLGYTKSGGNYVFDENNEFSILNANETIYNNEPILTVNLTSELAETIRNYNESVGSYNNNTLDCYDEGSYENIYCYSNMLDEWSETNTNNFTFNNRPTSNRENNSKNYFTPYTTGVPTPSPTNIGGPSWK